MRMNRIGVRHRRGNVQTTIAETRGEAATGRSVPALPIIMAWCALLVAARVVLVDLVRSGALLRIPFPPLDASLDWRPSWELLLPLLVGGVVVGRGAEFCARASWRAVWMTSAVASALWGLALALLDGASGVTGSVTLKNEYFLDVHRVGDPVTFLREFTDHLASYRIHVQGHPPGYLLLLSLLDRVGLGVPAVVASVEIAGGALAVVAVLVAVRDVAGADLARRAAPFVAISPAAIWIVSSADAFYAGVGAWAVALVVVASGRTGRTSSWYAATGGVLFGAVAFLSYGLVLLAVIPTVVVLRRRRLRVLVRAALGALVVVGAFLFSGFWWLDGLTATHARYVAGVAARRPYWPFLLADAACLAIVVGPALAVALVRLRDRRLWLLVGGALLAVALAGVSGMSKGEVERIWLPFALWILAAGAALTTRRVAWWLALQVGFTMFVQTLVRSPW
jgi:hypothetical protein